MPRADSLNEYLATARAAGKTGERIRKPRMVKDGGELRPLPTEHQEQVTLFEWAAIHRAQRPSLAWMFAIPNAGAGAQSGQAGKLKAEGVKAGVPDLCLPVPLNGFHGLYLELKAFNGTPSPLQCQWIDDLAFLGYASAIVYGWEAARDFILAYLDGVHTRERHGR